MTAFARACLAEILAYYEEGLLTDREVMPKVLMVFPLEAETETFWQILPPHLRREIETYMAADGPAIARFWPEDETSRHQEAAVGRWLRARNAAHATPDGEDRENQGPDHRRDPGFG